MDTYEYACEHVLGSHVYEISVFLLFLYFIHFPPSSALTTQATLPARVSIDNVWINMRMYAVCSFIFTYAHMYVVQHTFFSFKSTKNSLSVRWTEHLKQCSHMHTHILYIHNSFICYFYQFSINIYRSIMLNDYCGYVQESYKSNFNRIS